MAAVGILLGDEAHWRDDELAKQAESSGFVTGDEAADITSSTTERQERTVVHRWASTRRRGHGLIAGGGIGIVVTALLDLLVGWQLWMAVIVFRSLGGILYGAGHRLETLT